MQNWKASSLVALVVVGVLSCNDRARMERRLAEDEARNADQSSKLVELQKKVNSLEFARRVLLQRFSRIEDAVAGTNETELDMADEGATVAAAGEWRLLVCGKSVTPSGDGQALTLTIGNPYHMTFKGLDLTVRYGPREPESPKDPDDSEAVKVWETAYGSWEKAVKTKEVSLVDELRPGRWTDVNFVVAPARAEDTGFIGLTIGAPRFSLTGP